MKAFTFRLEQALRWRATQLDLEKSRTAVVARRLSDIRNLRVNLERDLNGSTAQLGPVSDGASHALLAAWTERTRRRIEDLEKFAKKAEQDLAVQTQAMLEANRRHHVIGKLKETAQSEWAAAFGRELETFAGETFLGRQQTDRLQSKKRARSSVG